MIESVPRRGDDPHLESTESEDVALAHDLVPARDLALRPDDPAAILLLQREIAVGMIGVVMRRQDEVELPAPADEMLADRVCVRRIDGRGYVAVRVMNKDAEIVASADELLDHQRHELPLSFAGRRTG